MGKIRKYKNVVERFLSGEKGQRFFNFAYSIGAAVVIWGALFKILHLPGGNTLLSIGMGTEVLMFLLTAFDRPEKQYHWEEVFPCYAEDRGLWRRYRVWDTVRVGMQYVNSAVKGKMYRGTSDNLAFRREAFFAHGGYARSLGLKWGEDDVWLRSVVKRGNARMELAAESLMTAHYDDPKRAHKELKLRRDFTSRFVRRKQFLVDGLMSAMNYGRVCALVAAVVLAAATGNWWLLGAVAALWLCAVCVNISLYNKEARLLHAPRLIANVPLQALWTMPIATARARKVEEMLMAAIFLNCSCERSLAI